MLVVMRHAKTIGSAHRHAAAVQEIKDFSVLFTVVFFNTLFGGPSKKSRTRHKQNENTLNLLVVSARLELS